MKRIASVFSQPDHTALITYITIGYPSIEATLKAVPLLASSGCDIVELGIPFSDPLADGVTIQKASFQALQKGVTPELCLEVAQQINRKVTIPLVFMSYFNPLFSYGLDKFCNDCVSSGISGLIIPDLPPDEGAELENMTQRHGLDLIYLLAPTGTKERIKLVSQRAQGFIYLVSVTGVTGTRNRIPTDLKGFVATVRQLTRKPLCIGFGISTSAQVKEVAQLADGVIIGSRIIQLMEADETMGKMANFIKELRVALDTSATH